MVNSPLQSSPHFSGSTDHRCSHSSARFFRYQNGLIKDISADIQPFFIFISPTGRKHFFHFATAEYFYFFIIIPLNKCHSLQPRLEQLSAIRDRKSTRLNSSHVA